MCYAVLARATGACSVFLCVCAAAAAVCYYKIEARHAFSCVFPLRVFAVESAVSLLGGGSARTADIFGFDGRVSVGMYSPTHTVCTTDPKHPLLRLFSCAAAAAPRGDVWLLRYRELAWSDHTVSLFSSDPDEGTKKKVTSTLPSSHQRFHTQNTPCEAVSQPAQGYTARSLRGDFSRGRVQIDRPPRRHQRQAASQLRLSVSRLVQNAAVHFRVGAAVRPAGRHYLAQSEEG